MLKSSVISPHLYLSLSFFPFAECGFISTFLLFTHLVSFCFYSSSVCVWVCVCGFVRLSQFHSSTVVSKALCGTDTQLGLYQVLQLLHCTITSLSCEVLQMQWTSTLTEAFSGFAFMFLFRKTGAILFSKAQAWNWHFSGLTPSHKTDAKANAKIPQLLINS